MYRITMNRKQQNGNLCFLFHISLHTAHRKVQGEENCLVWLVMPFSVKRFQINLEVSLQVPQA